MLELFCTNFAVVFLFSTHKLACRLENPRSLMNYPRSESWWDILVPETRLWVSIGLRNFTPLHLLVYVMAASEVAQDPNRPFRVQKAKALSPKHQACFLTPFPKRSKTVVSPSLASIIPHVWPWGYTTGSHLSAIVLSPVKWETCAQIVPDRNVLSIHVVLFLIGSEEDEWTACWLITKLHYLFEYFSCRQFIINSQESSDIVLVVLQQSQRRTTWWHNASSWYSSTAWSTSDEVSRHMNPKIVKNVLRTWPNWNLKAKFTWWTNGSEESHPRTNPTIVAKISYGSWNNDFRMSRSIGRNKL